jgi:ATP-dependent Clp protease ATP-binding subunit ClpC
MNVNDVIKKALKKVFRPEFINRIDEKVVFNTLSKENISDIVDIHLKNFEKRMSEKGDFKLEISKKMKNFLIEQSYDSEFGARPVSRAVTKFVQNPCSRSFLLNEIKSGDTIRVDYDSKKEEVIVKSKNKK